MTQHTDAAEVAADVKRIMGTYGNRKGGNLLMVTAGVHGNEHSGVIAQQRVLEKLHEWKPEMKGTFLALAGNVEALSRNQRFIDKDLNRVWPNRTYEEIENPNHEQEEMMDLLKVVEDYPAGNFDQRYFVDCHSTSADSLPYISVQDVGKNDSWAHQFPLYIVRGFSDLITGSIDNYFSKNQFTGFAYEGGQHTAEHTVEHQEAIIWLALEKAGLLKLEDLPATPECIEKTTAKEEQKTFEIVHRHALEPGDSFAMKEGYSNFQKIEKGEVLAEHNGKEVVSDWDARIFMPLYQKQGDDGFFVVEEV